MQHLSKRALILTLVLAGAATACGGDGLTDNEREAYGAYVLTAVDGTPLPFSLGRPCGERAERGYLELGEQNRFYVEIDITKPGCPDQGERTWVGTGIWTVTGDNVRLVSDPAVDRAVQFASAPAPFDETGLEASGVFEGEGIKGGAVTFRFDR
jgi:hypothetical protein